MSKRIDFVGTLAHPFSGPMKILEPEKRPDEAGIQRAGAHAAVAADAIITGAARLATPFVAAVGAAKINPLLAPVGFVGGTIGGAVGIISSLVQALGFFLSFLGNVVYAGVKAAVDGLRSLFKPTPDASDAAAAGAAALKDPPRV